MGSEDTGLFPEGILPFRHGGVGVVFPVSLQADGDGGIVFWGLVQQSRNWSDGH